MTDSLSKIDQEDVAKHSIFGIRTVMLWCRLDDDGNIKHIVPCQKINVVMVAFFTAVGSFAFFDAVFSWLF